MRDDHSFYSFYSTDLYKLTIKLKNKQKIFKRQVYLILDMVGDLGGLADGLFILLSFFLCHYNGTEFLRNIAETHFSFVPSSYEKQNLKIDEITKRNRSTIILKMRMSEVVLLYLCPRCPLWCPCYSKSSIRRSNMLKKVEQSVKKALDIHHILRSHQMINFIDKHLLSKELHIKARHMFERKILLISDDDCSSNSQYYEQIHAMLTKTQT